MQALVDIIGLGYVGLSLVLRFCEVRFQVLGFDTDPHEVEQLNQLNNQARRVFSTQRYQFTEQRIAFALHHAEKGAAGDRGYPQDERQRADCPRTSGVYRS